MDTNLNATMGSGQRLSPEGMENASRFTTREIHPVCKSHSIGGDQAPVTAAAASQVFAENPNSLAAAARSRMIARQRERNR